MGVGLLGHALGKIAGTDFHLSLRQHVLDPLEMECTSSESRSSQILAQPHQSRNKPTPAWEFKEVTAAAGSVRSSLNDMLKFLRANVDPEQSSLREEFLLMREPSEEPKCSAKVNPFRGRAFRMQLLVILGVFLFLNCLEWVLFKNPIDPRLYLLAATTLVATLYLKFIGGIISLLLSLFAVAQIPLGWDFDYYSNFFAGFSMVIFGWAWGSPSDWSKGGGDGRLAWQYSKIGGHPILWHNGMVGGCASYLGVLEEEKVGVVILANTAKNVDAIGDAIALRAVSTLKDG